MAFLKLAKKDHMDKPIIIELIESPMDVIGEKNPYYDKIEFKMKVKNVGLKYFCSAKEGESPFEINVGQEFDFTMTETLFGKINNFDKNEKVWIKMTTGKKGMLWDVKPATDNDIKFLLENQIQTNSNKPHRSEGNRDLEIKWGMAFNNATRLVAQTTTSVDQKDMVNEIKRIIAPMFQVACGMNKTIDFINKKEKTKKELEDELF